MADTSNLELEGDVDMESEGDFSELAKIIGRRDERKSVKAQQSKTQQPAKQSGNKEDVRNKTTPSGGDKSESVKKLTAAASPVKKVTAKKLSDNTKKHGNKVVSDVGDIADIIGILDSDSKKAGELVPKIQTQVNVKNPDTSSPKPALLSAAKTRKRKSSISDDVETVKAKKTSDINDESLKPVGEVIDEQIVIKDEKIATKDEKIATKDEKVTTKDETIVVNDENIDNGKIVNKDDKVVNKDGDIEMEDEKDVIKDDKIVPKEETNLLNVEDNIAVDKLPLCSEEDCRTIDTELVEQMMDTVRKGLMPSGDKYIVRFSPVEIGDLNDESVQKLITAQSNLAFYFKRQGKFKKKKGYAEVYLSQVRDAGIFIEKLLQIKLIECRVEVTVTVSKLKKDDDVCISKVPPETAKEHLQIAKVPASADARILRILFPFSADITFSEQKNVEPDYKSAVNVNYTKPGRLEAVLDCCSDFTYNGFSLSIQYTKKKQETKSKPDTEVKRDAGIDVERRNSVRDKIGHGATGDNGKNDKDNDGVSGNHKSEILESSEETVDEDISNMTRDVCSGMMESLNKLRQLGTDNPNVMRILEMQNELLRLQQSLSTTKEKSPTVAEEDPWIVSAADSVDDSQQKLDSDEKETDKKPSKEQKKKPESRAEKQRREMEGLQKMIEEAEEAKRQKEERAKRQLDIEKQKLKELEDKRKSTWARRMIEDAKQSPTPISGENASSKEEVQRILKLIENKRKEAEEAKLMEGIKGSEATEQAAKHTGGPDTILKTGSACPGSQSSQEQPTSKSPDSAVADDDDDTASEVGGGSSQAAGTQDTVDEVAAWSPNRALHEGVPVYTEDEFIEVCSRYAAGILPWDHHIRITYFTDRRCPVEACPATKYFKTLESFTSHWDVFHTPQVTVKFCKKCSAYFTNASELETHLVNRHLIRDTETVKSLSQEAREKIVANPSFRDPGKYLPPLM